MNIWLAFLIVKLFNGKFWSFVWLYSASFMLLFCDTQNQAVQV